MRNKRKGANINTIKNNEIRGRYIGKCNTKIATWIGQEVGYRCKNSTSATFKSVGLSIQVANSLQRHAPLLLWGLLDLVFCFSVVFVQNHFPLLVKTTHG